MRRAALAAFGMVWISGCAVTADDVGQSQSEPLSRNAQVVMHLQKLPKAKDSTCQIPSGWKLIDAQIAMLTAPFPAEIGDMITNGRPFTLGVEPSSAAAGSLRLRASGTLTDQSGNEYFPPEHPSDAAEMSLAAASFSMAAPQTTGWLHFVDGKSSLVWLPLTDITVHGTFPTGCRDYVSGSLDAVIPDSASPIVVTTSQGDVTIGDALGPMSSSNPPGWHLHVMFDAHEANVVPPAP